MRNIHDLLELAIRERASDLVLKAGMPPALRVDGVLRMTNAPRLSRADTRALAQSILQSAVRDAMLKRPASAVDDDALDDADERLAELESGRELDVVFTIPERARVRTNLFLQMGAIGAVLRMIPLQPSSIEQLRLPPVLREMAAKPQGLIVITGPTGSGKTTTMAALLDEINHTRECNIFTIEEPVEYVFSDDRSIIHQREVGGDTLTWHGALRSVARQSPDVIVIGEMRDPETMDAAMTAAEIGHLVITTLHTVSAAATIDRIINAFPQHLKHQVSTQLAASLLCVTSQRLVRHVCGRGRVPAVEVLTNSPRVRKMIEEDQTMDLQSAIREGRHFGMNTMNQALDYLYHTEQISRDEALQCAGNEAELRQMLRA